MKLDIIHSIVVCLAAFTLPFMVASCSSQEEYVPEKDTDATLHLKIEPVGQTRAGTASPLPDNEKMHSVRVIVLHEDGTVEHNKFYALEGPREQKDVLLKVSPSETKRIFLFANEESVTQAEGVEGTDGTLSSFLDSYREGAPGLEAAVNGLYFAPDYSRNIPMSSVYEMDFPKKGTVEKTFYVVRVATKFTVNFFNWRGEEVHVENFTIASHADRNFLMAHVEDSEQNRQLFKGKTWIDWLKEVSDASSEDDDYATTEAAGWLKDYSLPKEADKSRTYTHGGLSVGMPTVDIDYPDNSKPGRASTVPVFYLPESKNPKANATDGEQEYTMTIRIEGRDAPLVCKLPNLKALFRNTHVVVNVTMYNSNEIVVDVIPYGEVILDPIFGL